LAYATGSGTALDGVATYVGSGRYCGFVRRRGHPVHAHRVPKGCPRIASTQPDA